MREEIAMTLIPPILSHVVYSADYMTHAGPIMISTNPFFVTLRLNLFIRQWACMQYYNNV